ncbi:aldehyde reductase [Massilia sp. Root133]|uniref:Iron-containing alcohol dehydrogenase n=1 Tax=Massilia cellulosiltytica TaxID=2683234 RepID=A0A7X3G370_9BURK|nr:MULTISPECIES: iron-containing alcohol dehydrogenase [Telluria group]KQX95546.1 aldehyde reductase [Massilia sp. Root133]KQZ34805.1 aldehyde reductase [Massilia sp. Root1485]MVW62768.1 iron-containing alcohol dehydrogenase [Telluria cellulosilytica]
MHNFDFHNPTRILFGDGQIERIGKLVPSEARVLVLYGGGSIRANGTFDAVMAALAGRTVFEFGGIEPNPTVETLSEAIALVRRERVDFLLAVGGGSVIDGTKFVAAGALLDADPWTILEQHAKNVRAALPIGVVLTLPATGSEMNAAAVITRKRTQEKFAFVSRTVYPQFAVLDPTRTYTLPARQVGNGVVDAFVHVMEQYMTVPAQAKVQDRFAEGLLLTLVEDGPRALAAPENYDVRANLMWTATLALNGLIGTGVPQDWSTHTIGHELTALYGLDHAQTLAIVLPSMLRVRRAAKREKLLQYAARVWDLRTGDEDARIEAAIGRTEDFFRAMGVGTKLSDYGLGRDAIPAVIAALEAHGMTRMGETGEVTLDVARAALEGAA